nr:hypothetical protein [Immundisolibacter cernigliae]
MTRSNSASSIWVNGRKPSNTPALANTTSSLPCAATAAATSASTLAFCVVSTVAKAALRPLARMSAATASPALALMSPIITAAPWAAKARAVAAPIPEPPPVTITDLPSNRAIFVSPPSRGEHATWQR